MKTILKFTFNGNNKEQSLSQGEMINIGRSSKCDVQLEDEKISSRHCRLYMKKDRLEVSDLESKNGTYLNGIRIDNAEVFIGDQIKLGDTIISIEEHNCDSEALELLTFPGPLKERVAYELKADFTGARIQNQMIHRKLKAIPASQLNIAHAKEVELRKKARSQIKLSKEEIKSRNKARTSLATIVNLLFILALIYLPVRFIKSPQPLLAIQVLLVLGYLVINYRFSKFSLGEKISGIEGLYKNQ